MINNTTTTESSSSLKISCHALPQNNSHKLLLKRRGVGLVYFRITEIVNSTALCYTKIDI